MPITRELKTLLDAAKVSYEIYNHPLAYTAQEVAEKQHFSGNLMAKVVMVVLDGSLVMAVIPGSRQIDLQKLRAALGAHEARLANEDEFTAVFPGCEVGAMPPFGNLFGLPVFVDPTVAKDEWIYFNAGNHVQTVRIRYRDFEALVQPKLVELIKRSDRQRAA